MEHEREISTVFTGKSVSEEEIVELLSTALYPILSKEPDGEQKKAG